MKTRLPVALLIFALATLACGGTIALPEAATAGPTIVEDISVTAPSAGTPRLTISFGAGELSLAPGASGLLEGSAQYNVPQLQPEVHQDGANVEIKQGDLLSFLEPRGVRNVWDFKLGAAPMDLAVNAGAYQGDFELGGLALSGLTVKDGAASVELSFSRPNQSSMPVFRYETGASKVEMKGLANVNFSTMIFNSGAGDYTLDFTGDLQRDATVTITTGLSNLALVVPQGIPATVTAETTFSNVRAASSWKQDANRYTQSGSGPALTFVIKGGAGNLTLGD